MQSCVICNHEVLGAVPAEAAARARRGRTGPAGDAQQSLLAAAAPGGGGLGGGRERGERGRGQLELCLTTANLSSIIAAGTSPGLMKGYPRANRDPFSAHGAVFPESLETLLQSGLHNKVMRIQVHTVVCKIIALVRRP